MLLLGLLAAGCSGDPVPEWTRLGPTRGYVLISIDTLRADHLGCYGYPLTTSPFLDSLAARGAVFEQAFVQLPGTLPSHMSIFTGLYPGEHGVFPPAGVLSPDLETLPEVFQANGYRTGGHTEGGYMHGGYGFARGFDEFSHEAWKIETDVERTFARGLDFLRGLSPEQPFFLFLHTYAVHDPYFPAEEYLERFWSAPVPETFPATGPELSAFNRGEREMSEEALRYYRAAYDASIRYTDDVLRGFWEELRGLGLEDEVTLVVTSDHGEEFLEHGRLVHNQIYVENLRVPLLFLHPELEPIRIPDVVESIDIAPTLYDLAGIEAPRAISGRSLHPLLRGTEVPEAFQEAFSQGFAGSERSLVRRDEKGLHQLVTYRPVWLEGSEALELTHNPAQGPLRLRALSHREPRSVVIEVDGEAVGRAELVSDAWRPLEVPLPPGGGAKRIRIWSDGCPASETYRVCLAFRLQQSEARKVRLFDLEADPAGVEDLAASDGRRLRELLGRVESYQHQELGKAEVRELDPELEERLRSLGYLQ